MVRGQLMWRAERLLLCLALRPSAHSWTASVHVENPAKSITKKGFREKWVMGIIEDDSPYSLGEKSGMKKVLTYILPKGLSAPSHQTVQRDLDVLYEKLDDKVNEELH